MRNFRRMEKIRKIIHVDMDAFYASVEIRDNPALRGKPVVVGGLPGTRGVVCTCSYEARRFGIHSAMGINTAFRLCPGAVFLQPRREVYAEVSRRIRRIFSDYTDLVEPMSLDEAYLDVSENKRGIPYATRIAREIRSRIRKETDGLTASAGVSFNKFFAKIASDYRKPDGLTVILPEMASAFLDTLPIGKFYGVGKVTEKQFLKMGIRNGSDLKKLTRITLHELFGKNGDFYYEIARGIDHREVCAKYERKSLGTEETFEYDVDDTVFLYETLCRQAGEVATELKKRRLSGKTVTLKIKFFDFKTITRSRSLDFFTNDAELIAGICGELLQNSEAGKRKVRLIGVTVSHFPEQDRRKAEGEYYQPLLNLSPLPS